MKTAPTTQSSLQMLTAAAMILPGLLQTFANAAEEDGVDFQYSHYQEGKRDILGMVSEPGNPAAQIQKLPNALNPIEVDSLHGSARITLTDRVKFAFNYTQDTWSGATPLGTAPAVLGANNVQFAGDGIIVGASPYAYGVSPLALFMDKNSNFYQANLDPLTAAPINQITHVLATASPETRKQGDFIISYEWDEAALDVGGGISVENDYESRFVNLAGRMDFNQKQTTVNLGLSYTNSDTYATLDPDSLQFISTAGYKQIFIDEQGTVVSEEHGENGSPGEVLNFIGGEFQGIKSSVVRGEREDWGSQLGLTHVLNKDAILELGMGFTRSTGYMANPYKLVYVLEGGVNSEQELSNPLLFDGRGQLEKRPGERNQFNWHFGYNQYIEPFDAALHFDYRFAHDDWGTNAHTFEADWVQPLGSGWTVTPRIRYYSQSSADFYFPYITSIYKNAVYGEEGEIIEPFRYIKELPEHYSSDHRLSGFGALSGGVTISKQFAKGVQLEAGFEYYTHQGGLKIGGGGEQNFADYDFWAANAALKVNLGTLGADSSYNGHSGHRYHHHSNSPAGVMFDHTLTQSGDFMVGYRYMRSEQAGDILLGDHPVDLPSINLQGCGDSECHVAPKFMAMNMHMLDLMVAPTDWLTLMLMPQFTDMEMTMTPLVEKDTSGQHNHGGAVHNHQTGGVGDTGLYALFKLFDHSGQHVNLSLGGTAPTGDVAVTLRRTVTNPIAGTFIHYGMQLGSGTWDFKPSLTYTGESGQFSWGVQTTGTLRLEGRNSSGFAFGDIFQGSVWGGYQWAHWLTTTVRGVYTWQDSLRGEYQPLLDSGGNPYISKHVGPFDRPANYGGEFVDLGLGINITVPNGTFAGNTLKFEWLQPVHTNYNGYQLDRDGALSFTWTYGF